MIPAEFVLHLEYSGESIEETLSDGEHLTATVTPVKITDAQQQVTSLLRNWPPGMVKNPNHHLGWWKKTP